MFRSHSDHPQGARIFLTEVNDFKICWKCKTLVWWCGSMTYSVCTCALFGEVCRPPMPDIGTLGLQSGGWAWDRHPHIERTRLSRNSGNRKSMARKRAQAPQDDDDDYKKNNNNNPRDRNLKMTEVFGELWNGLAGNDISTNIQVLAVNILSS